MIDFLVADNHIDLIQIHLIPGLHLLGELAPIGQVHVLFVFGEDSGTNRGPAAKVGQIGTDNAHGAAARNRMAGITALHEDCFAVDFFDRAGFDSVGLGIGHPGLEVFFFLGKDEKAHIGM